MPLTMRSSSRVCHTHMRSCLCSTCRRARPGVGCDTVTSIASTGLIRLKIVTPLQTSSTLRVSASLCACRTRHTTKRRAPVARVSGLGASALFVGAMVERYFLLCMGLSLSVLARGAGGAHSSSLCWLDVFDTSQPHTGGPHSHLPTGHTLHTVPHSIPRCAPLAVTHTLPSCCRQTRNCGCCCCRPRLLVLDSTSSARRVSFCLTSTGTPRMRSRQSSARIGEFLSRQRLPRLAMLDQTPRTSRHGAPRRVTHALASCSLVW
jgi:hypothetical protein